MDATLPPGPVEKHRGAGEVTAELVLCGDAKPTITQCHCTSPAIPCQLRYAWPTPGSVAPQIEGGYWIPAACDSLTVFLDTGWMRLMAAAGEIVSSPICLFRRALV